LAREVAWRKRELASWESVVTGAGDAERAVLLRWGMVVLCGHLQGMLRSATKLYVDYVSGCLATDGPALAELAPEVCALVLCQEFASELRGECPRHRWVLVEAIRKGWARPSSVFQGLDKALEMDVTPTNGEEVARAIGVANVADDKGETFGEYARRTRNFIRPRVVEKRNAAAHGGVDEVTIEEYREAKRVVLEYMDRFADAVERAAAQRLYLAQA
jgi:hypothetical protein